MTPIDSLRETDLQGYGERYLIFFHTPLCGTCKLARRMLEIVEATLPNVQIYTCDANFSREILGKWEVQSVPALAYMKNGHVSDLQFAFHGVDELYRRIKDFLLDEREA